MLTMVKVTNNNSTMKYENTQLTVVLYFLFFFFIIILFLFDISKSFFTLLNINDKSEVRYTEY